MAAVGRTLRVTPPTGDTPAMYTSCRMSLGCALRWSPAGTCWYCRTPTAGQSIVHEEDEQDQLIFLFWLLLSVVTWGVFRKVLRTNDLAPWLLPSLFTSRLHTIPGTFCELACLRPFSQLHSFTNSHAARHTAIPPPTIRRACFSARL